MRKAKQDTNCRVRYQMPEFAGRFSLITLSFTVAAVTSSESIQLLPGAVLWPTPWGPLAGSVGRP